MNKEWKIKRCDEKRTEQIMKNFNLTRIVAQKLAENNLTDSEIKIFLKPTRKDFHNPFDLPDMEKAVERILLAIEKNEKIVIYGDYDADGITSTTILKRYFRDRNIEVGAYIPNRLDEGYGLNEEAIKEIAKEGYNLIITVDCGITGIKEVELAKKLGLDVIITDHHEVPEELPKAVAVVDAKRKDNKYPFNQLAGCGVAFKLIQGISIKLGIEENEWLKYIDIACIGTISDIVPLIDENRVIAYLGLLLLEVTRNIGLKVLMETAGIKKLDSTAVSFGISPRINACGRMGHQEDALALFLTNDPIEARKLATKIEEYNKKRQEIEKDILNKALSDLEENRDKKCVVLAEEGWHHGVIGIVSSKITELTYKPSILICIEGEDAKGSGRSIPGFDLHQALMQCQDTIDRFGGHAMAIGITIKTDKFQEFAEEFENVAKEAKIDEIIPIINIDAKIELNEINKEMVESLKLLEPYGEGNKMPIFAFRNLKIDSIRALSEGKHLKLTLKENNTIINAIGFNMGNLAEDYRIGDKIDVVGVLEINHFNGIDTLQINLKDIMKSI